MDRQTRRANFKKLQQPANTKLRSTRSTKAAAPMTLSEYFNTQESSGSAAAAEPENPCAEPRSKKTRDVEPGKDVVKPKKAPKLKASAPQRRARVGRGKKQPSISDFLRNEQLFAEVTAQHCMADNFSPDDIEMALVLSKSEAEKHGRLRLEDTEDEREEVVDLLDDKANQSTENVRRKLQKYGFRTAAKEDYNLFSIAALPGAPGRRGKRCKWANKFTPLTLRNPAAQDKKLQTKVAALLAQQVRTKLPSAEDQPPFELISQRLLQLAASAERRITHEPSAEPLTNLSAYYVQDLIEVSRTPAHHLLKSWSAIQGRDLSPRRPSAETQRRQRQLQQVYAELEAHFGASAVEQELDELEKLVADNMIQDESQVRVDNLVQAVKQDNIQLPVDQVPISSSSDSPPDKRARMMPKPSEVEREKENLQPSTSAMLSLPTQSTRCVSPDLFAESDDEPGSETAAALEMQKFSLKVYRNLSSSDMNSYEVYSSDEVKTVHDVKAERRSLQAPSPESFIDLTEEHDSPATTSSKSLFEQPIFPQSPSIEFDEDIGVLEQDLSGQAADCEISEELYAKYAYQTARDKSQLDSHCLDRSTNGSAKSNSTTATTSHAFKDSILSFSQLDSTRDAFQRSCSLTQSPGQSAQLEQSFKSPPSRRSKSFADKSALTFSHSDASIDLTQDSGDEDNESDNVLLSDEEINYSIWKADKTCRDAIDASKRSPLTKVKSVPFFRTVEDLDAYLDASPTPSNRSCNSRSPNKSALSRERAEFGILDAAISQPFALSQLQSPAHIDWTDASFLETPPEVPLKRYSSSCTHKFKELLNDISEPADELDDFDRLVFQNSSKDATIDTMPSGLDRLLRGEINAESLPQPGAAVQPPSPAKSSWEQLELNGQVYEVRVCRTPKPDFVHLSDAELLQQLYNCGIKPLKRKQAVKLLEYIYNQTHPIMLPPAPQEPEQQATSMPRSKSTPLTAGTGQTHNGRLRLASSDDAEPKAELKLRDAAGTELLRYSQDAPPALCDDFECFVLQTNVSKKTPQPLLPLHIAWHNLLCANPGLHERLLHFEPIDLQEIYLQLKQLGHRYEPKELKSFFDRRCIIFRYELAPPQKQAQRHILRKPKSRRH